jgi:hypothetical protein
LCISIPYQRKLMSLLPLAISVPSGEKATEVTAFECPVIPYLRAHVPSAPVLRDGALSLSRSSGEYQVCCNRWRRRIYDNKLSISEEILEIRAQSDVFMKSFW